MSSTESGVTTGTATSSQAGGSVSGSVKDMASSAMDTVARDAMAMASDTQGKAAKALEDQKRAVGGAIEDFASAIRKAGEELSESDQTMAARLVRQAADGLEHLSHSLADRRPQEILDAARDFGRRNPVAFAAGAALLGLALGRLARSTGRDAAERESSNLRQGAGGSGQSPATEAGFGGSRGLSGQSGDGVAVYGEEGFTSTGDYATPGGSAPQEEMQLTDTSSDPVDPSVDIAR